MSGGDLRSQPSRAQAAVRALQEVLAEKNQRLQARVVELEHRLEEHSAELCDAHEELSRTNSELMQITMDLDARVSLRTAELETANQNLAAARVAALNLMDDAVAARRQAEAGLVALQREVAQRQQAEEESRITRERTDEEVRRSEEKYRQLFEAADDAIVIFEPDGEVILEVNPRACELYGLSRKELVGKSLKTLTMDVPQSERQLAALRQSGVYRDFESVHLRRDGSSFPVLVNSTLIGFEGRKVVLSLTRDITERKKLEEQLRHSQKMEAVGQLAGGVAHDFNNLLQAMLSLTQVHAEHLSDAEQLKADTAELEQLVKRGAALTRQLLLFSRRETVRTERLDLNEVVRDGVTLLRRLVKANIAIEARLAEGRLPVEADRGQLEQILVNLAVNAVDAMSDGGRLAIETGSKDLTVWVKVIDTGGGIPAAARDHVFEPFFTTKERGHGTGLGLSVVHGIVIQHGGAVRFESVEGQGTTFTVTLPRAGLGEHPAVEIAERGGASPRGHGELVLVVEDEDSTRQALAEILTLLGYEVTAVGSGEEARRLAAEQPFDLLLTDLMLPGISGGDLAAGLLARRPDLRVVLMSGYAEDAAIRLASQTSPVHFLQKPFDMDTLARELRAALETG